jgi:hypothetical protein
MEPIMSSVFSKIAMLCAMSTPVKHEGSQFDIATRGFVELLNNRDELEVFVRTNSTQYCGFVARQAQYGVHHLGARHWWDRLAADAEKSKIIWAYIESTHFELDDMLADRIHSIVYNGVNADANLADNMDVVHSNMNNITSAFYKEYLDLMYDMDIEIKSASSHVYYEIAMEMCNLKIMIDTFNAIDVSKPMDQWPDEDAIHNLLMQQQNQSFGSFIKLKLLTVPRFFSRVKDLLYSIDV